jgi:hypothetical protein
MTASVIPGHRTWSLTRDGEGHRVYKVTHRVQCDPGDGPAMVLAAFGLPQVGDPWRFGRDLDEWAWCHVDVQVTPVLSAEGPDFFFDVEHTFSTLPPQRPQQPVSDPLLQAPKISGSFTKTTEEAVYDRFGRFLGNSAWEQLRGKQVEVDTGILNLHIEQNLPSSVSGPWELATRQSTPYPCGACRHAPSN